MPTMRPRAAINSPSETATHTIMLGRLSPLLERGLAQVVSEDRGFRLVLGGLDDTELERETPGRAERGDCG